jgi:hypothetical protein
MRWLAKPLAWLLGAAVMAGLLWLAIAFIGVTLGVLIMVGIFSYSYYSVTIVCRQLLHDLNIPEMQARRVPWLDRQSVTVRALAVVSALPVVIVLAVAALVFGSLLMVFTGLHDDYDVYGRTKRWLLDARISENKWVSWIRPWLIAPASLLVLSVWYDAARFLLLVALLVVVVSTALAVAAYVADRVKSRRRAKRAYEVRTRPLAYHQKAATEQRTAMARRASRFSRLRKIAGVIGDYLALVWTVIVTMKWKICPIVKLPE